MNVYYASIETREKKDRDYKTLVIFAKDFEHCAQLINRNFDGEKWYCESIRLQTDAEILNVEQCSK